jgi:hypothetical protein
VTNPRTPFWVRKEIVRRRLSGYSRDAAVKGLAAAGVGSEAMREFVEMGERDGLMNAAREFGVGDIVNDLLRQSKVMQDHGDSFDDVDLGIEVSRLFDALNVPKNMRREFTKALRTAVKTKRPASFVKTSVELAEHVEQHPEHTFTSAVADFDQRVADIEAKEKSEREKTEAEARKVTDAEASRLAKLRQREEELTRNAKVERARVDAETAEQNRILRSLKLELDSTTEELSNKRRLLKRVEKVEQMDTMFAKQGVTAPEEKAAVLLEVQKSGGNITALVHATREYRGLDRGLKTVTEKLGKARGKLRDTRTAIREHDKELERTLKKESEAEERLGQYRINARSAKNHLKYLIRKTARVEGLGASLKELGEAIQIRKTNLEVLQGRTAYQEGSYNAIVGRVSEAEGCEKSINGLKESIARRQGELDDIVRSIAKTHNSEPTLRGLEIREATLNRSVLLLTKRESDLIVSVRVKTDEVSKLQNQKNELDDFFRTVPKTLESIEAKAKENKRLLIILRMFDDRIPLGPWKERFEAMGALGSSFGYFLSFLPQTPQITALAQSVARMDLLIGDAIRAAK